MTIIRDDALALRRVDFSETSLVIVLFTREHGKVRVIAKGIKRSTKKRFAAGVDLLDIGQVAISSRAERSGGLAILTEWKQSRSLAGLREKLFRLYGAEYEAEVTSHLTEEWDRHEGLYDVLVRSLTELCDADEPLRAVVRYQLALLTAVGSLPVFGACAHCERTGGLTHFSSFEGGMICRRCASGLAEKRPVSAGTLRVLQGESSPERAEGAFALLNYHIAHLMGRGPLLAERLVSPRLRRLVRARPVSGGGAVM